MAAIRMQRTRSNSTVGASTLDAGSPPLVSVIVPAFNAERTLRRTLASVLAQTYPALELIVVDDGSCDGTLAIARSLAETHANVRVISGKNRGVSHARNWGIAEARGEYVAPLDADDLWHPTKLARQMEAMLRAGSSTALVYCPYRSIDEHDLVTATSCAFDVRGYALCRHLLINVVGNGSSALMRKSAVLECGGYDSSLHCEDLLLQLRIAERYPIDCVREYLVGYRKGPGRSTDFSRMTAGLRRVHALIRSEVPEVPEQAFRWGASAYLADVALTQVWQGGHREGLATLAECFRLDPVGTGERLLVRTYDKVRSWRSAGVIHGNSWERAPRTFWEYSPTESMVSLPPYLLRRRFAYMDRFDVKLSPKRALEVI
jgi:glycosyltransferase involved in cell wall biosynthesis